MSVQNEITRIAGAVEALTASIAGKGVTVPAGTKIDGLAALVDAISAGGSGGSGNVTFAHGTYTPTSSNALTFSFDHNLGRIPVGCVIFSCSSVASASSIQAVALIDEIVSTENGYYAFMGSEPSILVPSAGKPVDTPASWAFNILSSETTINIYVGTRVPKLDSGVTYKWVVW